MTKLDQYPEVVRFLDSVCGQVRAKKLHLEIREELSVHLDELYQDNLDAGMPADEAIEAAVARMGEPRHIGKQLDYTHRPKTDWAMLALIALLTGAGLLAMFSLQSSDTGPASYIDYFARKCVHIGIGVIAMAVLWSCDYQKLKKYSEVLFGAGVFLPAWLNYSGTAPINGQSAWYFVGTFGLYIPTVSILLMIVGLAGIKPLKERDGKGVFLLLAYRGMLPIFLLMQLNVNTMAAVYGLIFFVYLWLTKRNRLQVIVFAVGGALMALYDLTNNDYRFARAFGFLNRGDDPQSGDYLINRSIEAMQSAGWWGRGELPANLPFLQSEGLLPGFIYYFGWIAGTFVLSLVLMFIGKMFMASLRIKDEYGKLMFASVCALFAMQYVWAAAMVFGYAPYVGISLPLLSYGGTDLIFQFAALGLLLGIYRRKDMIPAYKSA